MKIFNIRFTLIEMLVAVAVMCILASILLPVIDGALSSSRKTTCQNNLKNIAQLWQMWGQSHKFNSPAGESSPMCLRAQDKAGKTWVDHLMAEGDTSEDVFQCSEQPDDSTGKFGYGLNPLAGATWSYMTGKISAGFLLTPGERRACLLSQINYPGKTVIICDSGSIEQLRKYSSCSVWKEDSSKPWKPYVAFNLGAASGSLPGKAPSAGYDWGNALSYSGVGAMGWNQCYRAISRHNSVTCAMADGSVQSFSLKELVSPDWGSPECMFDNQPQ